MKEVEPFLLTGSILFGAVTALGGVFVQGLGRSTAGDRLGKPGIKLPRVAWLPVLHHWLGALFKSLGGNQVRSQHQLKRLESVPLGRHQIAHLVGAGTDRFLVVFGNGGPPAIMELHTKVEPTATRREPEA